MLEKKNKAPSKKGRLGIIGIFFASKTGLCIVSVLIAVVIWLLISVFVDTTETKAIGNVVVALDPQSDVLQRLGLVPVDFKSRTISVQVTGDRNDVFSLNADSVVTSIYFDQITGPGSYNLPIRVEKRLESDPFEIVNKNYGTINVNLDRIVTRSIDVSAELPEIEVADGYMKDTAEYEPKSVEISGPEQEVSRIASAKISLDNPPGRKLDDSYSAKAQITLFDRNNKKITLSDNVTISTRETTVTIPVLKFKTAEMKFTYSYIPPQFPAGSLNFSWSKDNLSESARESRYVEIAGPKDKIDLISSIEVGYINVRELRPGVSFNFPLAPRLPSGCEVTDGTTAVTISLDMPNLASAKFSTSNIRVYEPVGYTVDFVTKTLNDIELIGDSGVLENMTGDDIVVEVNFLNREIQEGRQRIPVQVFVPGNGAVWAYGNYQLVIDVAKTQ
ncbi:MAG: hypothetical protein LBC56_04675 [Oscillospiraceae bacterium]|jgi:YbbR domain-containing protein|nr:hypothetical protein [Oscillospiraceae bacterium]